ncbi:MAG TPA: DUF3494 domain-containing protein [Desulfuromonadales bacterium]|nr:DUF3494 domain-containing protein [Desulfuromonadales bacterium]
MKKKSKKPCSIFTYVTAAKVKCTFLSLFAVVPLLTAFSPTIAEATPILGSAQSFAALGAATVTNGHSAPNATTTIFGNLGVTPGSAITGFYPDGAVSGGTIHTNDGVAQTALADARTAYNMLAGMAMTADYTGFILGSAGHSTLTAGVYNFNSSAQLNGNLVLDFQNVSDADFVFNIGSTLTTASASRVSVINGNSTNGVYWRVGSSATLGSGSTFEGNILALASVGLDPTAQILCGRAVALTGAVTMTDNRISNSSAQGTGNGCSDFSSNDLDSKDFGSDGLSGGGGGSVSDGGTSAPVPEPGTMMLLGSGLLGLVIYVKRRQNSNNV